MKAAIFHQVGMPLTIEDIPQPKPRAHQVVIKVGRCGFCATDVAMTSGVGMTFPLGAALGHEYCGEAVELGPDVTRLRIGDMVAPEGGCGVCAPCLAGRPIDCIKGFSMMLGGFGEYTLVDERFSVRLPSGLSIADGALVEPAHIGFFYVPQFVNAAVQLIAEGPRALGLWPYQRRGWADSRRERALNFN